MAAGEIVICPYAGENAVHQTDLRAFRRDKAADLRHQHNQRDLTNVSGFPGHVRAGNDGQPQVLAVERCVVRDKLFFQQILIQHRMPPVFDDELQCLIQFRPAIPEEARRFGQCTNDVENRNGGGSLLDRSEFTQSLVAQFLEKLVFELAGALVCAKNFRFDFLQLRGDEAFAANGGLPAGVMGGHVREVRFRHLDEIAEDRVVAHLERLDPGGGDLALL